MMNILVFIVSFEAEREIRKTLERIPESLLRRKNVHFLCIDDASPDDSASIAQEWIRQHGLKNFTLLRNAANQGYGGNQKLGYRFALDEGFDYTILLHADGQYAPEFLTRFIETIEETKADVVLGSRMKSLEGAWKGGMPIYKMIGNRLLTRFQNWITGRNLSEYHTGYRAYATRFLRRIPFEINTNDFHFDTEILMQAFYIGANTVEFPIPTHYGQEICHVKGLSYAYHVIRSTVQFKMHQFGIFSSTKYRNLSTSPYGDKTAVPYSSHQKVLGWIGKSRPKTVLDLGCGPGYVANWCQSQGIEVLAVDSRKPLLPIPFQPCDLEREELPVNPFDYDLILMLDILEHLSFPENFLLRLRNYSVAARFARATPQVVLSTPNIAFIVIRLNLLLGRFNYAERGILDFTHKRLFTRVSFRRMLRDCGYVIEEMMPVGVPFAAVFPGRVGRFFSKISDFLARFWPGLFAYQYLVICHPLPGVAHLLHHGEKLTEPSKKIAS